MIDELDTEHFEDAIALALARCTGLRPIDPPAGLKLRLLERIAQVPVPDGFSLRMAAEDSWVAHPVPGIRVKVLSVNRASGYATLLLDVSPGARFPAHHHSAAEECYVLSGSLHTCGRLLGPGDFVHADAGTDHPELWTDEGCRVLLIVPPDEHAAV
jgi:anti-sigma factor ChrR (cupin superfamily)